MLDRLQTMTRAGVDLAAGEAGGAPDTRVARYAARQHGRLSVHQLAACGLDDSAIARRVVKGHLHRVHLGVYAVGHPGETLHARFMAAVLAGGEGAVLSHWAAGVLWGILRWDDRPVDVTARGSGNRRRRRGLRFHRSRSLAAGDVTSRHGIRVVSVARMLLEIAPQLSDRRLRRAARQALAEELVTLREIQDVIARGNGHRGTKRLAGVVAGAPAPTLSGHEDDVLDLVLAAGLEHPDVNRPLVVGGTTYRPDMRWAAQRLILEVDSSWHDDPMAQACDAERQADLEAFGERVLRTRRDQALAEPRQLVARLVAAGAPWAAVAPYAADSNQRAAALAVAGAQTRRARGM
jgi:very-short-patch-repair endonuclease